MDEQRKIEEMQMQLKMKELELDFACEKELCLKSGSLLTK
jgi:hypothetical protein